MSRAKKWTDLETIMINKKNGCALGALRTWWKMEMIDRWPSWKDISVRVILQPLQAPAIRNHGPWEDCSRGTASRLQTGCWGSGWLTLCSSLLRYSAWTEKHPASGPLTDIIKSFHTLFSPICHNESQWKKRKYFRLVWRTNPGCVA